jgi:peptidoglycan/xylan/chitin deacetylase (PgdA/CDA1 family)
MARYDGFRTTPMMTLDELMLAASIHEIGAHSYEHASMAMETDRYLADDARMCASWLHKTLGLAPAIYAFPNGSHRAGQAEIVRSAGFRHVLLVRNGFSQSSEWCHPRFGLYGNTCAELKFRAVGGMAAVRAGVKRPEDPGRDNEPR